MDAEIKIPIGKDFIYGNLNMPDNPKGIVVFAHGSGSGRGSPRNNQVAEELNRQGFATLLVDLLTEKEAKTDEMTGELRFDIELLAQRVRAATDYLRQYTPTRALEIGYFGASTGAAAALSAAADKKYVSAVVSRGGRPDLAIERLPDVDVPTLLLVGANDPNVADLNRRAMNYLQGNKKLVIIPNAGHLFEEPGAMERVTELTSIWFNEHLGK